jgi:DNA-binding GntR family transcriptional regulator
MVERITEDELETAHHAQKEMEATKDIGQWVLLNRRFHGGLVAAARSPRLAKLIGTLEDAA